MPPTIHPDLGPRIAALRQQRGLSMSGLARRADLDTSMISRLEGSERNASREVIERLADALDATLTDRHALLVAGGFLTPDAAHLLDDPDLSRLAALLTDPTLASGDREVLVTYVRLALGHAAALGYPVPEPERSAPPAGADVRP